MIDEKLKQKIMKSLDTTNEEYFKECYKYYEDGKWRIAVYPVSDPKRCLTVAYNWDTGEFVGPQYFPYAKKIGERV